MRHKFEQLQRLKISKIITGEKDNETSEFSIPIRNQKT